MYAGNKAKIKYSKLLTPNPFSLQLTPQFTTSQSSMGPTTTIPRCLWFHRIRTSKKEYTTSLRTVSLSTWACLKTVSHTLLPRWMPSIWVRTVPYFVGSVFIVVI